MWWLLTTLIVGVNTDFISENHSPEALPLTPVTIIKWDGFTNIPGAFLLSRINLNFINMTCDQLLENMIVASQVVQTLTNTILKDSTEAHKRRYAYQMLQVESEIKETLEYLTALLLCPYDSRVVLWDQLKVLREELSYVWHELKNTNKNRNPNNPKRPNKPLLTEIVIPNRPNKKETNLLISFLEKSRPKGFNPPVQTKSPLFLGLGLGFLGAFPLWNYFGSNNDKEISKLNSQINRQNKLIRITNERIDLLVKTLTKAQTNLKDILDKLIANQQYSDIHYAIMWNFDQIKTNIKEIKNTFKLGELTITLLENGILNAELVELKSFKRIIEEGLKAFPDLKFPLEISRHTLHHIIKMIKIQRIDHQKFVMVIPLTQKQKYEVYNIVPHPLKLTETSLVLPKFQKILLVHDDKSYISTTGENIYSIHLSEHLLLDIEPIYSQTKITCEWAAFNQNTDDMIKHCNYDKLGQVNDTFVIETEKHRIVYFTRMTQVTIECPSKTYSYKLSGLHRVHLSCDIITDLVIWPSKQKLTIDIEIPVEEDYTFEAKLPILKINKSSQVHSSLRELMKELPNEDDSLTIDFDYYGLTDSQVQTYTVYSQATLFGLVVINSCVIAFLLMQWIYSKRSTQIKGFSRRIRNSSLNDKFRGLRDSVQNRIHHSQRLQGLRDSIRSRGSRLIRNKNDNSPRFPLKELEPTNLNQTNRNKDETSMLNSVGKDPNSYPALPRYI